MVRRNAGEICERKTLFRMKKEADQALELIKDEEVK